MSQIVIIEDDPLMSRMYQKIFTFEGFTVETAANGEEGLEKINTVNPTIVILDIMMPKMNGLEVLDHLKANPNLKNIPVVVLTNLAGQQDAELALEKGAIKYIIKSEHEPREIVQMIKEVIAGYSRNTVPTPVNL